MTFSKEFKVGLFALGVLGIFYVGINFLQGNDLFSATNTYYVQYKHASGLEASSPVFINGVAVGTVKAVKVLPKKGHAVQAALEIQQDIQLKDSTVAKLISRGLLAGKGIELVIKDTGKLLPRHATIPGEIEKGLVESFEATQSVLDDAKSISLLMNKFMGNLVENTSKINTIITNLASMTEGLKKSIVTSQKDIQQISHNIATLSNDLVDSNNGVGAFLEKLNYVVDDLKQHNLTGKLNQMISHVEQLTQKMMTTQGTLPKLLNDDTLYKNLNKTLVDLDQLLVNLKEHPGRYVSFSLLGSRNK